ncbi:YitT family protein [Xinfangfangia sp. CPCC 101601]|uniref:YitT family protein n=1 Tax=Pseudogemmobacter lacusdianii TaxID=3069608 RepID=A0ABU0VUI8_9RHOB|nr:YitT family protein [Xinfangfangia sp. CPCC 101601]MDQ2065397.1 YitT family protein [Xinfangfangia sp. CPCC 101601]
MSIDLITPRRHSLFEDFQGILIGSVQAALGVFILRSAGLVTGGTAGTALVISYLASWNFSLVFLVLNLPFFIFAYMARGRVFLIKNIITVALVALVTEALKPYLHIDSIHPAIAAILFGISSGVGLLGLFRHASSLGGISIVALVLQDRFGVKAGWIQLGYDVALFAVAFWFFPLQIVAWSLLGTAIVNFIVALNHRRDWYVVS